MFQTIHTGEDREASPAFAVSSQSTALGRTAVGARRRSNGRNSTDHIIMMERGLRVFYAMNAAPPESVPAGWMTPEYPGWHRHFGTRGRVRLPALPRPDA